jgi:glycerol-3-phosphate O-acyltransferase
MTSTVALPLWLLVLILLLALWAALERLLIPSVRFLLRRRVNRVLEEINTRLKIQVPSLALTKREVLIDRLIYDPQVLESVDVYARENTMPREVVMERVVRYAREIVPAFNAYAYFRFGYWLARNVARSLYRVRLGYPDEVGFHGIARRSTIVFLMNHRSNMDYILVSYLAAEKAALSYAVGEWARIWPLQTLIRSMGAYFVRRNSRDALYRSVLGRYVSMATSAGVTQAVFPEGGLSRDGTLRPPKLGLLDYMVRSFDPAGDRDIAFIPVGINYDRTLEDRTLLSQLDSDREKTGKVAAAVRTLRFAGRNLALLASNRWHRFGYACVNFGSPVSLKAWMQSEGIDFRALEPESRRARVEDLGKELMEAVAEVIPAVPVSLAATVFTRDPGKARSELELKTECARLMETLSNRGAHVYVPRGDQDYAIAVGLRMLTLRHLVDESDGLFTARSSELPLLTYYANSIAHLFLD